MAAKNASTLRFDISALPLSDKVLDKFPELREYPVFAEHGEGDNDPYLRLSIWYADKGSEYRDLPLDHKKQQCLKRAGVPLDGKRAAEFKAWQDEAVIAMISQYVRLQASLHYALWFHGSESAWQTIEQLSTPIAGAKDKFGEDDEAKTQTAYKTRKDNLDAMFVQVPKLEALAVDLFMGDEGLVEAEARAVAQGTRTTEGYAANRSFVKKPKA